MKRIIKTSDAVFAAMFVLAILGCGQNASVSRGSPSLNSPVSPFTTFRDIPGVTVGETAAIETLQQSVILQERGPFLYGMTMGTESFRKADGSAGGYAALICEWLTGLFGIPFQSEIYEWNDLFGKLDSRELDFTGNLMVTEERLKIYYMTDTIAERDYKVIRLTGSRNPNLISERPIRYGFLRGSVAADSVAKAMESGTFEFVWVNNNADGYHALENGDADAYIGQSTAEASFEAYDNLLIEDFLPLVFDGVSIATANQALEPVISVITKALRNGAIPYLNRLYRQGYEDYRKNKFLMRLSGEEKAYLQNPSPVPLGAQYSTYPTSFYNAFEKEWEGLAFDVLAEVEKLTGLTFEIINDENTAFPDLLEMLYDGKIFIIPSLAYTREREDRYIWPKNTFITDQYALISKWEYPNVSTNEIPHERIALMKNSAPTQMFHRWFPGADKVTEYNDVDDAFLALNRDEVDLVMASTIRLLTFQNYQAVSGYKANYLFNYIFYNTFGFNKDQTTLCSIVDKALHLIDTEVIEKQWMTKTYDYKIRKMEEQRPWLVGVSVLSLVILFMMLVMFLRGLGLRKLLAKVVAEKTYSLTAILDGTPDIIFHKNLRSCFTECNKAMEIFTNLPKKKIIGKQASQIFDWPPEKVVQHIAREQKVFREMQQGISEEVVSSYDGMSRIFEIIRTPLIQDGKVVGLIGVARDITRRKAAEDQAKESSAEAMKAYAEAETASEAKSRFIANMSHEMRTPMNVIVGLTDLMLEEDDVPDNAKETLKKINTAGNTLMGLINDVLDISKIEAGRQELTPVQYEVASLLNDIIALNIIRIGEKPITFKLDIDEKFPCTLFGDDLRIKQILNNLLSNAFKYTKEGSVTLQIRNEEVSGDVWVSFSVVDTGVGIRKEDMVKLFSDYNQVDTRANREIEGTGLGLSITKKFVELMEGEISVESEYGKGTCFKVRIRQGFVSDQTIGKETAENLRAFRYTDEKNLAKGKPERLDLSYARVLVVDDFPMNLDVAAGMLRKYKMQVDCVTSGQEAVDRLAAGEPVYNAVFMDHMMPGMDGVEATKLIRALGTEYAEKIPVIALTANAVAGSEQMFLDNGFNAFLPKPFSSMFLDSVVRRLIKDK